MSKRIYKVEDTEFNSTRLVRANTAAQALSHVTKNRFNVKVASQEELVQALADDGVTVETAGNDDPPTISAPPVGDPPSDPPTLTEEVFGVEVAPPSEEVAAAA